MLCSISGTEFSVGPIEKSLRKDLRIESSPTISPLERIRHLGAFWQHWGLYKRLCDRSKKSVISLFPDECPYQVWQKDLWISESERPALDSLNFDSGFFETLWELFKSSPIPHNLGTDNENCEYADDCWNSQNCYLLHSGVNNQNLSYSYRAYDSRDSLFTCFAFNCELCADVINSKNCYEVISALNCEACSSSAFLFDCKGCANCFMCSNLRHATYCIGNIQFTKVEYEKKISEMNLLSRSQYQHFKNDWQSMIANRAFHQSKYSLHSEDSTGDYLGDCKRAENCFFTYGIHNCANCVRGSAGLTYGLDCIAFDLSVERMFSSVDVTGPAYEIKNCAHIVRGRYLEYCNFCMDCSNCFGCSGLVSREYCIFNRQYSEAEYQTEVEKIIQKLKEQAIYNLFFPGYFAATSFEQSWSGHYLSLSESEQQKRGFRISNKKDRVRTSELSSSLIPDSLLDKNAVNYSGAFWDDTIQRPFSIAKVDYEFFKRVGIPFSDVHYIRRLQQNAAMMPFSGFLETADCANCSMKTETSKGNPWTNRILCKSCYNDLL